MLTCTLQIIALLVVLNLVEWEISQSPNSKEGSFILTRKLIPELVSLPLPNAVVVTKISEEELSQTPKSKLSVSNSSLVANKLPQGRYHEANVSHHRALQDVAWPNEAKILTREGPSEGPKLFEKLDEAEAVNNMSFGPISSPSQAPVKDGDPENYNIKIKPNMQDRLNLKRIFNTEHWLELFIICAWIFCFTMLLICVVIFFVHRAFNTRSDDSIEARWAEEIWQALERRHLSASRQSKDDPETIEKIKERINEALKEQIIVSKLLKIIVLNSLAL